MKKKNLVVMNWQIHTPTPGAIPGRDFKKLNKMSIKNKLHRSEVFKN